MDAIDLRLRLGRARGLTAPKLRTLCATLDGRSTDRGLPALFEASPIVRAALLAVDATQVAADRRWIERESITLLDLTSPDYPALLAQVRDAPVLLYVSGNVRALSAPQVAIAGTRKPSPPARVIAYHFAAQLARAGLTITSGLALGIDAAGHEGALQSGGQSVAVLGTGLDRIYPAKHRTLAQRIAAHGALVSEFPPGTAPLRANFPRRNRIISGLSSGVLVVEAAGDSGSLITAGLANDQGREVFAIPGSINNPLTRGCHALIRSGAKLVEDVKDILEELKFNAPKQTLMQLNECRPDDRATRRTLDKEYKILLDAVGFEAVSLDVLVDRTGLPSQTVASMLLLLELEGAVGIQAGGQYVRL
jgi:DNA processing protein